MKRFGLLASLFLLVACGAGASFAIDVIFPDAASREQAQRLLIQAVVAEDGSSCSALLDGSAEPGDAGYSVEQTLDVDMATGASGPLEQVGPGPRLFFVRAYDGDDQLFLHGCAAVEAGGSGPQSVSIQLEESCQPSNGGVEICDGEDNDCNGATDDGDPVYLCPGVPRATASDCSDGVCGYTCDQPWENANDSWSDGCECRITRQGEELCDGLDNDCDGLVDEACIACTDSSDCEDSGSCLTGTCDEGVCSVSTVADGTACDDGNACTQATSCQGGLCEGSPVDCDDVDPCTDDGCDPQSGCTHEFNNADCDDGDLCTENDVCDGAGTCRGSEVVCDTPPDPFCVDGTLLQQYAAYGECRPESGCYYAPEVITCEEGCVEGGCRSAQCDGQAMGTACDDENACTEDDACDLNEVCRGTPIDCNDDNPCTTDDCDSLQGCTNVDNENGCDDGDPCTVGDVCSEGSCGGSPKDCSDGLDCTEDSCLSDGTCENAVAEGYCVIGGACLEDGTINPVDSCWGCDAANSREWTLREGESCDDGMFCNGEDTCDAEGACISAGNPCTEMCMGQCLEGAGCIPDQAGTECDDGAACTAGEACDGMGACVGGLPDDELCAVGEICEPACDADGDGCTTRPTLVVDCPQDVPISSPSQCSISLQGAETGAACLSCAAFLEPKRVGFTDFGLDGAPGQCNQDGWMLWPHGCAHEFIGSLHCDLHNEGEPCCDMFVCPSMDGEFRDLVAFSLSENYCGWMASPQVRLERPFQLEAYEQAELCWDFAFDNYDDGIIQVQWSPAPGQDGAVLMCQDATFYPEREWIRDCTPLSSDAFTYAEAWITFWLALDQNSNMVMYLDNISLDAGWYGCPSDREVVFADDLTGCPGDLSQPWNGWTFTGDMRCAIGNCSPGMVGMTNSGMGSMERVVDTRGYGRDLELCLWRYARSATEGNILVELDPGDGSGWQLAGSLQVVRDENACRYACIDLSGIDGAANNPALGLRIIVECMQSDLSIGDLRLMGMAPCPVEDVGNASAGALVEVTPGEYEMEINDNWGRPLEVQVQCTWGEREEVRGGDTAIFQ